MKTQIIILGLLALNSLQWEFTNDEILKNQNCNSSLSQQSPINLDITESKYYDERNFRILNSNYTFSIENGNTWNFFPRKNAIGFQGKFGNLTIMKNWALNIYQLNEILIKGGKSAHKINNMYYDGEIHFVHSIVNDTKILGRYLKPSANKLVIVVPFLAKEKLNNIERFSDLFNDLNVIGYNMNKTGYNVNINKSIRLEKLIKHDDQLLYEGTLEEIPCEKAIYIINMKYQLIKKTENDAIVEILNSFNLTNSRDIQNISQKTIIYRNSENLTDFFIEPSNIQYEHSIFLSSFNFIIIFLFLGIF
jgi:carbonic anhydrase